MTSVESLIKKGRVERYVHTCKSLEYIILRILQTAGKTDENFSSIISYSRYRYQMEQYILHASKICLSQPAIAATLLEIDLDIEFSSAEWTLCDK